jgi:protein-tyrosine-phosphatase
MKTVYICGDSFAVPDPTYGSCWVDLLAEKPAYSIKNLAKVCACNLHIALQVEHAIANNADFIIYLATSSFRNAVKLKNVTTNSGLDRFVDLSNYSETADLTSYSMNSLDSTTRFDNAQIALLKEYHVRFDDPYLEIKKNQLIIEGALSMLKSSNIPFIFDQGGFEHKNFAGAKAKYFTNFASNKADINLWDHVTKIEHRPYYHIKDLDVHQTVASYYHNMIVKS